MQKIILFIGLVSPEPNSSAAGARLVQLMQMFLRKDYQVVFASSAGASVYAENLEQEGITCFSIELNSSSFNNFIQNLCPQMVLFDRFVTEEQFSWRVKEACPEALCILDTEDLHCLRFARQEALKKQLPFQLENLLDFDITKREIASILRSDLSLIISDYEMQILHDFFRIDISLLYYLPLMVEEKHIQNLDLLPAFNERQDFISIGNFLHAPNWDAVKFLKQEIWPLIRKDLPYAKLLVYGAYASEKVFQLNCEQEGFLIKSRAESSFEVFSKARVLLAPLRFGAGIKGKLLESMLWACPNITTKIGIEGMGTEHSWNGLLADEPKEFAKQAVALYRDEVLWLKMQIKGRKLMEEKFLLKNYSKDFFQNLEFLVSSLVTHRRKNFIGSLLQHESLNSIKYMSKWIELKNSKKE